MSKPATLRTEGVHHVGLTVLDVAAASDFFTTTLGFEVIGERPAYPAVFLSDGAVMLTLWQVRDPDAARAFDRKACIGLHHLALRLPSVAALHTAFDRLSARDDVTVEFAPEPMGTGGRHHMMLAGPSGVRLELVAEAA